jgi:MFS family permease
MTFFGSTANDAAFNAWITDNTTEFNRSKTEGALGVFAAIGTALVFGLDFIGKITYNTYYDAEGNQVSNYVEGGSVVTGNWTLFFLLLGGLVLLIGIVGKYFLEENPALKPNPESSYKSVLYGFKLSVIKENKFFYICLAATSLIGIANMVSGPYSLIYIERSLGFKDYIIPFAVIGFLTVVFAFIFGSIIDKKGRKSRFLFPGLIIALIGNIIMFFSTINNFGEAAIGVFCVGSTLGGVGGAIMGNVLSSKIRDFTPSGRVGLFQGVRMTFNIMIPMVLGPLITALITTMNAENIIGLDEYGNNIYNYSSDMFIVTCLIMLFVIIPFIYLMKTEKKSLL